MKRLFKGLIALLLVLAALPFAVIALLQTEFGRGFAARTVSSLASSDDLTVEVSDLRVDWTGDIHLSSLALSDADGPWLTGRDVTASWSPLSLLGGRLDVSNLHAGDLALLRQPSAKAEPDQADADTQAGDRLTAGLIPTQIRAFGIGSLRIGSAILGEDLDFRLDGSASLSDAPNRIEATIDLVRLAQAQGTPSDGTISAKVLFAPADQTLTFSLKAHEPRGGLLARLMEVPNLPALDVELIGQGPLSDWGADLKVALDGRQTVTGKAGLRADNGGYLLTTDLDGALAPLVPGVASAFFIGTTDLTGRAFLDADFRPRSGDFQLVTGTLKAQARGSFEPESETVSLTASLDVGAGADRLIALDLDDRRIAFGPLSVTTQVEGNLAKAAIDVSVNGQSLATSEGHLGPVALSLVARDAVLTPDAYAVPFRIDLRADAIEPIDDALKPLAGTLTLEGDVTLSRETPGVALSKVRLTTPVVSLDLSEGYLSNDRMDLAGNAGIGNLEAFSSLAGQPLSGAVAMTFDLKGTPDDRDALVTLSANGRDLSFGSADIDKLLTGTTTLTTSVRVEDLNDIFVENAVLKAHGVEASGTGHVGGGAVAASVTGTFPDMTRLHPEAAGALSFSADVRGPAEAPEIKAELTSLQMLLLGTALENLKVTASGTASSTQPSGRLRGSASLGGAPLTLNADLSGADGSAAIRNLLAVIGGNSLSGSFDIADLSNALETLDGRLELDAPDLSTLSPLLLRPVAGRLKGSVIAASADGPNLQIDLKGGGLSTGGTEIGDLTGDIRLRGTIEAPKLSADVLASGVAFGETVVETASVQAETEGNVTRFVSDIRLTRGDAADGVQAEGTLEQAGETITITLTRLDGRYAGLSTDLASPAVVVHGNGATRIASLVLNLGSGSLSVTGSAADQLALSAEFENVPMALANAFAPTAGISGTLSGSAKVTGEASMPKANWSVSMAALSAGLLAENGLPSLNVVSTGELSDSLVTQSTTIAAPEGLKVTANGRIGLKRPQSLDLAVNGAVPLAILKRRLTKAGFRASGTMALSGSVTGMLSAPQYIVTAVPNDVTVTELSTSLSLKDVSGSLEVTPARLKLSELQANLVSGGSVAASGSIALTDTLDANISIKADRARYIDPGLVTALVNADIAVAGPLASATNAAVISGTFTIDKADVSVPETLPGAVSPVAVRHVNTPARVREQLNELGTGERAGSGDASSGLPPRLNIRVRAPGQIFVRGRGLDAELFGDLTIAGTTAEPQAVGAFTLKRGQLDILTRRLQFSKGQATFSGSFTPSLDFVATTSVSSTTINVTVQGPADDPLIGFSSAPELPQDEVLALLLFGKGMGSLSAGQIAQLATAITTLTGGNDNGPLAQIRKSLGLDALDINTDGENGPSVGVGKYVRDNIYLGVEQGTGDGGSRVKVDIDLDRGLKVRGEVGADGSSKAGVFFEKEY